ncbi:restriction endonuclease subunit S [Vibrio mediterranei]|uniref:restriction endonuclease subunit S n=1 Tax=Vibrio mediterranei TaxID=689 RepID=UPI001EFCBBC8|nr:restriction endonuclease subunit S [Vibrio mediterranei]
MKTRKLPFKADQLPKVRTGNYTIPCLTSSFNNQGLNYFAPPENVTILKNVISIPSNSDVYRAYYQPNEFTVLSDAYAIRWAFTEDDLSPSQYLFAVQCINKITDLRIYSYKSKLGGWNVVKEKYIKLPTKCGEIDFEFMESFIAELEAERIAELEAYLDVTGLSDCELTEGERKALEDFTNDNVEWGEFSYQSLFSNIQQGRRLKKDDQKSGNLPFVMSGVTNTGVVNHIANSVFRFPKNSITVDIFGNAFYRNYDFGAGDDTGVYWNSEKEHSKNAMLFIASSLERSIFGKFSYGKKLRSSRSLNFQAMLPSMNNEPNYSTMELLISAIQKIVIKDVVEYADTKIQAHKEVIHS